MFSRQDMKADDAVKRLFVGGLGRDVTSADLRDRFSRFGDVSEVEMITRRDDQGNSSSWVLKACSIPLMCHRVGKP